MTNNPDKPNVAPPLYKMVVEQMEQQGIADITTWPSQTIEDPCVNDSAPSKELEGESENYEYSYGMGN